MLLFEHICFTLAIGSLLVNCSAATENKYSTKPLPLNKTQLDDEIKDEMLHLKTDPLDVHLNIGEMGTFQVYLSAPPTEEVTISVRCASAGGHCNTIDGSTLFNQTLSPNRTSFTINITATEAGHDVIEFTYDKTHDGPANIIDSDAFVRVRVGHSKFLEILGMVFGWMYMVSWSISFWPQNVFNFQRKSVIGLNFDFTLLHWSGFLFYTIFNLTLYFSTTVQSQYEVKFPRSEIPIELNDIVYSVHAVFVTSITWAQCFIYEQGGQRVSIYGKLFQLAVWSTGAVLMVLAIVNIVSWLNFIYFFSYVKLIVTALKYLPQVIFNIRRKSTAGWSIYMIYLDVVGGTTSMLQMLTIAYNFNDWKTLLGNLPKLGLALASMFYDVIFLLQEYVFYPDSGKVKPRNSLANLSLRSTFKDEGDDDDSIDEFFRKLSISNIRASIFKPKHDKATRHSEPNEGTKSNGMTAIDLNGQLANGRRRSMTNVH